MFSCRLLTLTLTSFALESPYIVFKKNHQVIRHSCWCFIFYSCFLIWNKKETRSKVKKWEKDRKCQPIVPAVRANAAPVRRHLSELRLEAWAVVMATGNMHFSLSETGPAREQERHWLVQHKAQRECSDESMKVCSVSKNIFMGQKTQQQI